MAPRLGYILYWIGTVLACFWLLAFFAVHFVLPLGPYNYYNYAHGVIMFGLLAAISYGMGYAARRVLSHPPS
jgi:hypothetical protein